MKNNPNTPTRSTVNAHEWPTTADTNKTRALRTWSEFRRAIAEGVGPSVHIERLNGRFPKPPVCAYSRKQALADGLEVQVPKEMVKIMHEQWDIIVDCPVFLTKNALQVYDIAERCCADVLLNIFCALDSAADCPLIGRGSPMVTRIPFQVSFGPGGTAPHVWLNLAWSTADIDDPTPSLTILMPDEE